MVDKRSDTRHRQNLALISLSVVCIVRIAGRVHTLTLKK